MIINLVSGPRNISTALMYSFAQRNDTTVVDEPFYASYLQRTGLRHPGRAEVLRSQNQDAEQVLQELQKAETSSPILFIKNMAQHMEGLPENWFDNMTNVFLIRDPKEVIISFSKVISKPTMQDFGLAAQVHYLKRELEIEKDPIVIDMEELLDAPGKALSNLCEKIDIPFQVSMLEWEKGPRKEDGVWAEYWYSSVHASTGFKPYQKKDIEIPKHLLSLYKAALPHYNVLKDHCKKFG